LQTTASIAIVRPESVRLGGITPGVVSSRGRRSLNADAFATYTKE